MEVTLHDARDGERLRELVGRERRAVQRDRYRAVLLVAEERLAGDEVAGRLGRSPRFVDQWVARYRRGGLAGLVPRKPPGKAARLTAGQAEAFKARLDAGPRPADGVCALRGRDAVRILEREFGVRHTIGSIYGVLDRIGYSCLAPRPRHEKGDPAAAAAFREQAPFLSGR